MGRLINRRILLGLLENSNTLLFDVRDPVAFRDGTIPGAINLPVSNMSQLVTYPRNSKVIFFGENETDSNLEIALKYASQTFNDVMYITNKNEYFKTPMKS